MQVTVVGWITGLSFRVLKTFHLSSKRLAEVPEKLRNLTFLFTNIPVTLRLKLVHHKEKTPRQNQSNILYRIPNYTLEKQRLHKQMVQHRRVNFSGQVSGVHLHVKEKGHSFKDSNVHMLTRGDRWFEKDMNKAICVKLKLPLL